ncbi:hypothetical protein GDO86_020403 [Hymenochirus boettgeri]|uniref:Cap-specific mRNA (nucleoside-2'-O-)-methyltransferase 1 n=1 Tax=Hymenochirus boettgeri TaxID=247094 RepID=A0A8T2IIF5_9PIPI|nr:hypothetical protein GDO86_020403 [Hymenochirus boettgeri]
MKRRSEPEVRNSTEIRKKKKIEELGLNLSSTSDDDTQYSNQGTQESSTSGTGSDSDGEEKRPVFRSVGEDASSEPVAEGSSSRYSMYNSVSQKLMAKMGFREGEGLGKFGQGRKEIVETSNQKGRRGLGLVLKGFEKELNINWRQEPEATAYEEVDWFPECTTEIPDADELSDWMTVGKQRPKERDSDLLYFADVCAGPGGFSEYVLWRKKWHAKGFGMTLKGPNDFKLEDFYAAPSELFEPYYGEGGVDGDGDVTRPENITAFRNFVLDNTEHKGVHFMMADGGFSVEGQENIQEILSKQLLLCQFLVGLSVIRTGGHFICKTFDLFTPFSVGLVYLLYCCFERVSLFKPLTSRPANSERTLSEPRQADIRKECLKLWGVPDQARVAPTNSEPKTKFFQLIQSSEIEVFGYKPTPLTSKTIKKLSNLLDFRCMVCGSDPTFLLGLGRSQIYTWAGRPSDRWTKIDLKTELPRETLLSVEIVYELKGEGKAQRKISAIHVLDALFLNGTDVRKYHFNQRIQLAEKFVKAVSKPSRPDMNPIRVKEVYRLEEIEKIFLRLEMKVIKGSGGGMRLSYTGRDDRHFLPCGLYIVKTINDPWTMAFSKSHNKKYFYNSKNKQSSYEVPVESIAPFNVCYFERLFWEWDDGVHSSQKQDSSSEKLSKDTVLQFIQAHHPFNPCGPREER